MPDSAWSPLITQATDGFTRHFDTTPDGVWSAPGRANLIGEHTDYNGGFVLPFAIDRRTIAAVRLNGTDTCRVASALYEAPVEAPLGDLDGLPQWATYILGVASILTHDHPDTSPRGFDAFITSDVPWAPGSPRPPLWRARSRWPSTICGNSTWTGQPLRRSASAPRTRSWAHPPGSWINPHP